MPSCSQSIDRAAIFRTLAPWKLWVDAVAFCFGLRLQNLGFLQETWILFYSYGKIKFQFFFKMTKDTASTRHEYIWVTNNCMYVVIAFFLGLIRTELKGH